MKKTGELLKKAREEKGLSIQEIGLSLKINSKILRAIEDGDQTQLPAKTFLRGFVQSYANYLKLNQEEVLSIFSEEMGSTRPQHPTEQAKPTIAPKIVTEKQLEANNNIKPIRGLPTAEESAPALGALNRTTNTKTILITAVLAILIMLITITKKIVDKYQRESVVSAVEIKTPIEEKPQIVPPTESLKEEQPQQQVKIPTEATAQAVDNSAQKEELAVQNKPALPLPTVTSTTALSPSTSKANMSVSAPSVQKSTQVALTTATPVTEKKPEEKPIAVEKEKSKDTAAAEIKKQTSPDNKDEKETKKPNKNLELIVEALDTVELEFSTTKGNTEKVSLNAEQVHRFKSNTKISLNVSNGGAINVILNGRDLGVPGSLGKPIKLSY